MTRIKDKIARLDSAKIPEDEIVALLHITHLVYRRYTEYLPSIVLSNSCKRELFFSPLREEHTLTEMARLYKTTYSQVHMALYQKHNDRPEPTNAAVLQHLIQHDDLELTRKHFGIAKKDYDNYLIACGWKAPSERSVCRHNILAKIILHPEKTYTDIALESSVSTSYVANIASEEGISRQDQSRDNWPEVLAYAREHSVSSAARLYNVSRAAIYYHSKKEDTDA